MKLILTLLARNEADIVGANLAFHLNAGVDFVIATDNASDDGTTEILEAYEREGCLRLVREPGEDMRQGEWVTRMARLAAEAGADWVIHGDADEFYWPRGSSLKEVLEPIPDRFGTIRTFVRSFLLRPDDNRLFSERMTARLSTQAPIHDPASILRPGAKIIHRGEPHITLSDGTHSFQGAHLVPLHGWYPIELLHFPFRSRAQVEQKVMNAWGTWSRNPNRAPSHYYANAYSEIEEGRLDEFLDALTVDDEAMARGIVEGSLVVDTRLRDALRAIGTTDARVPWRAGAPSLALERPDIQDEALYAMDAAVLHEADVARLQRRADELERRIAALEG